MELLVGDGNEIANDLDALLSHYRWPADSDHPAGRPWIRTNFAAAVDGAITGEGAKSQSVSSRMDKTVFALLRATCDAVLVGAGTARTESYGPVKVRDSMKAIRESQQRADEPTLAIVTRSGDLDPATPPFTDATSRTVVVTCASAPRERIRALEPVADIIIAGTEAVDLTFMGQQLAERGFARVLCEGGPHLFNDLVAAEVADELCLTISPLLVGGEVTPEEGQTRDPGRIARGPKLPAGSANLQLASALQHYDALFTRWLVRR